MKRHVLPSLILAMAASLAGAAGSVGPGSYVNPDHPDQALELRADGTYLLQEGLQQTQGRWEMRGGQLVLLLEIPLQTDGDAVVGPDGKRWARSAAPAAERARMSANEAAAIGDLRTIMSAEAAYSSANGSAYGDIACLISPADCIHGFTSVPFLLDREMAAPVATRHGYVFRFTPGKAIAPSPGIGKRSLEGFVYSATPAEQGKTGVRGFAVDGSGLICFTRDGRAPVMGAPCDPLP